MRLTKVCFNWKEAATVILFAKNGASNIGSHNTHTLKHVKQLKQQHEFKSRDYRILTLERASKSSFMPSAYVFPGGTISQSDYSDKWHAIYRKCGVNDVNNALPVPIQDANDRAPMFTIKRNWPIDSNVAFRICSIRETFEEAGILICRHSADILKGGDTNISWEALDKKKLQEYRPAIQKDPVKFLDMCQELSIVPDIWSLHEWSCWLTPTNMDKLHSGRRFDTAFYICGLHKHVDAVHDQQEIVHSKWVDPGELLQNFTEEKVWLAPPQIYELRRLCNFDQYAHLKEFCVEREQHGCVRWLPVRSTFQDGIGAVLPGDDLYPDVPDLEGVREAPEYSTTMEQSRSASTNLHRFDFASFQKSDLVCNVPQTNNHLEPKPLKQCFTQIK